MEAIPVAIYPFVGILFFLGVWVLIFTITSRLSKWGKMADVYPNMTTGEKGETKIMQFVQVNKWANYKGTVIFEATSIGLRIKQIWPFKIAHPTLFIPWSDVESTGEEKSRPMYSLEVLKFTRVPDVKFGVYKTTADWIIKNRKKYGGR